MIRILSSSFSRLAVHEIYRIVDRTHDLSRTTTKKNFVPDFDDTRIPLKRKGERGERKKERKDELPARNREDTQYTLIDRIQVRHEHSTTLINSNRVEKRSRRRIWVNEPLPPVRKFGGVRRKKARTTRTMGRKGSGEDLGEP